MTKSHVTYLAALLICLVAFALNRLELNEYARWFYATGVFSLAGSLTNGLAIHMLFEKVPFLIGSGVIPNRFEAFKSAIKGLMMDEFFNEEILREHWEYHSGSSSIENLLSPAVIEKLPLDRIFNDLVATMLTSPLGSLLKMAGGNSFVEPLRAPLVGRMRRSINEMVQDPQWQESLVHDRALAQDQLETLRNELESVIDARLAELTPQKVKQIVQKIIREHLGWLVIWGGVLGGVMGLVSLVLSDLMGQLSGG